MILRDLTCSVCGNVLADVMMEVNELVREVACDECRQVTAHTVVCNGGCGVRYRCNDFSSDPADYRGQITVSPPTCHTVEGDKPVESAKGGIMHEAPKFTDADRRNERQDRFRFERDRQKGRRPIYSDGAAKRSN